jgi:hypothetical protein
MKLGIHLLLSSLCSLLHQGLPHSQDQVEGKILFDSIIPGKCRDLTRFQGIRDTDESNSGNRYGHHFLLLVYINTNTKWKETFHLRCLSIQFRKTERFLFFCFLFFKRFIVPSSMHIQHHYRKNIKNIIN